jgi:hypothetical protein
MEGGEEKGMAVMHTRVQVEDYEAWKERFDTDPVGARKAAKGHRLFRNVEDPNDVLISVEFVSAEDARAARETLVASGVLDRVTVKNGPTITDEAETVVY